MDEMTRSLLALCATAMLAAGCAQEQRQEPQPEAPETPKALVETVLTQEEQDRLTSDEVLKMLQDGNRRFTSGTLTARDHSQQVRAAAAGQFPKAIVLSCVDSRVPVERCVR